MNGDDAARTELQELLLDGVPLPSDAAREAMLDRTFTSDPGAGADLLPPDGLFDPAPDDTADAGPDPADGTAHHDEPGAFPDAGPGDGDGDGDVPDAGLDQAGHEQAGHDGTDHDATDHDAPPADDAGHGVDPGAHSW